MSNKNNNNNPNDTVWGAFVQSLLWIVGIEHYRGEVLLTTFGKKDVRKLMGEYDQTNRKIYMILIAISAFGALIQYSASCYMCANGADYDYDAMHLVKRQIIFLIASFFVMYLVSRINYEVLFSRLVYWLYGICVSTVFLLKTSMAVSANGAKRWVSLFGPIQFAPAELIKIAVFVMLAYMAQKYSKEAGKWFRVAEMWLVGGVPAVLVWQLANDLSSAAVILLITFGITLVTTKVWWLHVLALIGIGILAYLYVKHVTNNLPSVSDLSDVAFRDKRIIAWLYPERYYDTIGYQVANTLYIVGAGGLTGQGLGSFQMLGNLVPYAYTDVIFGVLVYELGLVGAIALFALYFLLLAQIFKVIMDAEDIFGSVLALGVFLHIAVQILMHVSVVLNLMPNTGQTLPWVSYSGSTTLCLGLEIGILLSIMRLHYMRFAKAEIAGGYNVNANKE